MERESQAVPEIASCKNILGSGASVPSMHQTPSHPQRVQLQQSMPEPEAPLAEVAFEEPKIQKKDVRRQGSENQGQDVTDSKVGSTLREIC